MFLLQSRRTTKQNKIKQFLLFTINDLRLIFIVFVVKIFCFKSHTDSSIINPIVEAAPRENIRSPQRGILFVLANKRFDINT